MGQQRSGRIDNLRALLIFLVVLGHMVERVDFPGKMSCYMMIYAFHMPGFALVSGLCFKRDPGNRTLKNILYPYVIFQTLYLIFDALLKQQPLLLQYTTPFWLLWYLMALAGWNLIGSVLRLGKISGGVAVAGSVVLALLVGLDPGVGYFGSLSRMFVLLPFFLLGMWAKQWEDVLPGAIAKMGRWGKGVAAAVFGACCAVIALRSPDTKAVWFYHSMPYDDTGADPVVRLLILALAMVMLACLWVLMPQRKLGWITYVGQNTMPVFLLHGFVVLFVGRYGGFVQLPLPWLTVVPCALATVAVLSAPGIVRLTRPLMRWPFEGKKKRLE